MQGSTQDLAYGASEWDKPCTKAYSPLTINVKAWPDRYGRARVDFDKHVRFVPSNDPSNWVVITFADMQAALDPFFNILYRPGATAGTTTSCYDESKTDPSLVVTRNPLNGRVTRRVKHFSGYNVAAGRSSDEGYNLGVSFSIAPSDLQFDSIGDVSAAYPQMSVEHAAGMLSRIREARHSGYVLASG